MKLSLFLNRDCSISQDEYSRLCLNGEQTESLFEIQHPFFLTKSSQLSKGLNAIRRSAFFFEQPFNVASSSDWAVLKKSRIGSPVELSISCEQNY